jgi:hypothetical protein
VTVLAFWEIPFRSVVLDLAGGAQSVDKQNNTTAPAPPIAYDSYSVTLAQADLKYMFSPSTMIGGRFQMTMYPEITSNLQVDVIKPVNVSEISLLLRFGF